MASRVYRSMLNVLWEPAPDCQGDKNLLLDEDLFIPREECCRHLVHPYSQSSWSFSPATPWATDRTFVRKEGQLTTIPRS